MREALARIERGSCGTCAHAESRKPLRRGSLSTLLLRPSPVSRALPLAAAQGSWNPAPPRSSRAPAEPHALEESFDDLEMPDITLTGLMRHFVGACCRNLFHGTASLDGIDSDGLSAAHRRTWYSEYNVCRATMLYSLIASVLIVAGLPRPVFLVLVASALAFFVAPVIYFLNLYYCLTIIPGRTGSSIPPPSPAGSAGSASSSSRP